MPTGGAWRAITSQIGPRAIAKEAASPAACTVSACAQSPTGRSKVRDPDPSVNSACVIGATNDGAMGAPSLDRPSQRLRAPRADDVG